MRTGCPAQGAMGPLTRRAIVEALANPRNAALDFQLRRVEAFERLLEPHKRRLFDGLGGTIVEIGPGLGTNFAFFERGSRWIGIEPDDALHDYLEDEARHCDLLPTLIDGGAEVMPVDDGSADAVVSTLVLCSVQDPARVLQEVIRVLRPGGSFYFIEHIAARKDSWRRLAQKIAMPVWRIVSDGCHVDRQTNRLLESAGFASLTLDRVMLGRFIADPHIIGRAQKSARPAPVASSVV